MNALRTAGVASIMVVFLASAFEAQATTAPAAGTAADADTAILQQAANAMIFQVVLADLALATSQDDTIKNLAQYIRQLSKNGLETIEHMATDCEAVIDAHLDATAWRRVGAMREIGTAALREQVYLDAQLMRLYEARQENLDASVRAQHAIVKGFAMRSEPEIEDLILKVRNVAQAWPTSDHR